MAPVLRSATAMDVQRVVAIINPAKAQAPLARSLIASVCHTAGWPSPTFLETTIEDAGTGQAREAIAMGATVVLAGGGDGTVRAVAGVLAHTGVALGLIPIGTGNLLARNLGLHVARLEENARIGLLGHERAIDMGLVTLDHASPGAGEGHETTSPFLVLAGMGMDARVIAGTRDSLKKNLGWLAYGEASLRHLDGPLTTVSIAIDDGPAEERAVRSVLVGNCGLIPAGIQFIPGAIIDDGLLDVVVVSPTTPLGWVPIAGKVLLRHRRAVESMQYHTARKVVIRPSVALETQLDGDITGVAREMTVHVESRVLTVRVPAP
jgi:diacylglycerol kinase family enzyme